MSDSLTSNSRLAFSMGNGELKFTAENDGDIVRITIKYGNEDHRWYYLDRWEAEKLRDLLSSFIGASEPPSDDLRAALVHAVSVIQTWHNMDIPERDRSDLWDIYWKNAPEMKQIRAALTKPAALDDEALIDRAWNRYRDGIRCVHCDGTGYDAEHACEFCDASGVTPPRKCALPPEGWECSRGDGHDGPCAATQWAKSPKGNRCLNPSACLRAADGTECWPCDHGGARHE